MEVDFDEEAQIDLDFWKKKRQYNYSKENSTVTFQYK